jgi:hypothetical protein
MVTGGEKSTTVTEIGTGRVVVADLQACSWAAFSPDGRWLMQITGIDLVPIVAQNA